MGKIIETSFGTRIDPHRIAAGSVSAVRKQGPYFIFTVKVTEDDIREYSFTDRQRAQAMREVFIKHLEQKILAEGKAKRV